MTFIKVHESLADGEHSARLSLKYHIIIIIKAVFSFTVAKKKKTVHKGGRFMAVAKSEERGKGRKRFNEQVKASLSIKD